MKPNLLKHMQDTGWVLTRNGKHRDILRKDGQRITIIRYSTNKQNTL